MRRLLQVLALSLFATALAVPMWMSRPVEGQGATEAPTGFDTLTNGLVNQADHDGRTNAERQRAKADSGIGRELAQRRTGRRVSRWQ